MSDGLALAFSRWLLNPVWLGGPAVDQTCETDFHDSSVCEVDGKAVAANPHEGFVREHVLEGGRKPDTSDHEVPTNGSESLRVATSTFGNEEVSNPFELSGPE